MPGYVNIQGELKANGDFSLLDDSQYRGGFRTVTTITERDSILSDRQKNGMLVYVTENGTLYRLDNADIWTVVDMGLRTLTMPELDNYMGLNPVIADDFLFDTILTETETGGNPSLTITNIHGECIVFVSINETATTGKRIVTQTAICGKKMKYRTTSYNSFTQTLFSANWTGWKDCISVVSENGDTMKIWTGDATNLPSSSDRAETKTLYIVLENGVS